MASFTSSTTKVIFSKSLRCVGGRDFDQKVAEYLAGEFCKKNPGVQSPMDNKHSKAKLLFDVEKTRKKFVGSSQANFNIEAIVETHSLVEELKIEQFDSVVSECTNAIKTFLSEVKEEILGNQINDYIVELVDDVSRLPCIQKVILQALGLSSADKLKRTLNPETTIARGATLFGQGNAGRAFEMSKQMQEDGGILQDDRIAEERARLEEFEQKDEELRNASKSSYEANTLIKDMLTNKYDDFIDDVAAHKRKWQ